MSKPMLIDWVVFGAAMGIVSKSKRRIVDVNVMTRLSMVVISSRIEWDNIFLLPFAIRKISHGLDSEPNARDKDNVASSESQHPLVSRMMAAIAAPNKPI